MGIFKKGDNWYIDYYVSGRRKREMIGPSHKVTKDALNKRRTQIAEGRFLDIKKQDKIEFGEFAKTFIELHSKLNKRPRVARRDEFLIKRLGSHFNGKYLYEITPQLIERYKSDRSKQVAPATVNRELACLKCMFNKAITWGKTEKNPVREVKLFRENNQRIRYLEKEEIKKLLENSQDCLRPILIVALFTGMRKSEILGLKWQNINIEHGVIYLLDTKNGERREVIMNKVVRNTLIAVPKHPDSPYVFYKEDGSPYKDVRKYFETTLKKCGIIDFRFHDLRHTFASQLVMMGVDLKTVQELMGHKSIEMTLRYSHLSPDHKKKAVELLDRQMDTIWTPGPNDGDSNKVDSLSNLFIDKELELSGEVA